VLVVVGIDETDFLSNNQYFISQKDSLTNS